MKKFSKTEKILITIITFNVVVWFVLGFISWKIFTQDSNVQNLIGSAEKDLRKDSDLRNMKSSLFQNRDKIMELEKFFIAEDKVVDFIENIESVGKESGVELTLGSVSSEVNEKNPSDFKETIRLKLEARGSWTNVYHFLKVLESLPFKISIDSASIGLNISSQNLYFTEGGTSRDSLENEFWTGNFDITVIKIR